MTDITNIVVLILAIHTGFMSTASATPQEYCESDYFSAQCPQNQVVMITQARYGRIKLGRCIKKRVGMNCELDVIKELSTWCAGRMSCNVPVSKFVHEGIMPCSQDYRSALEADYNCTPAVPTSGNDCIGEIVLTPESTPVYFSSELAGAYKCATVDQPLLVTAKPGQQISITLLDFSPQTLSLNDDNNCKVLTIIKDLALSVQPKTMCSGLAAVSHVMTTVGNQAEIRVMPNEEHAFLLKIEVLGCADPPLTTNTQLTRNGNQAEISCAGQEKVYKIKCEHGVWTGALRNCSHFKVGKSTGTSQSSISGISLSQELSIAIIALVALLVGVVILGTGILCLKKNRLQCFSSQIPVVREHEQYWPPPPPSMDDMTAYNKSSDGSGLSNEYYRTWQLQHHHHQNANLHHMQQHPHSNSFAMNNNMENNPNLAYPDTRAPQPPPYSDGVRRNSIDLLVNNADGGKQRVGRHSILGDNTSIIRLSNGSHVEHIYESPKFDRDSVYSAPENATNSASVSNSTNKDNLILQNGVNETNKSLNTGHNNFGKSGGKKSTVTLIT